MQMHLSYYHNRRTKGFTLVELLTVMTIIGILAALVLGTFKYAQDKGARSRAESEIKAMEAALESYKADNGAYPSTPGGTGTDGLDSKTKGNPTDYKSQSLVLYRALSGDTNLDRVVNNSDASTDISGGAVTTPGGTPKIYFEFKSNTLQPSGGTGTVTALSDPWGNSYGYSTIYAAQLTAGTPSPPTGGNNPTFDLWSTGGTTSTTTPPDQVKWLKNW